MRALLARARAFWRTVVRRDHLGAEMRREMQFHIDMEAERLARTEGLDPVEARRRAAAAFGGLDNYVSAGRDVLGLTWLRGLSTDVKLGVRMTAKYPGLTVVAVLALSLAIGAGATYREFVSDVFRPALPLAGGERVVGVRVWDASTGRVEKRIVAQFVSWRDEFTSLDAIGACRELVRNLITPDGRSEIVQSVAISATAFAMAQVPPILGRPLVPEDEAAGAAPVAVIGHDLWQARFAGDPGIVGRDIRLGRASYTVVGVMPAGFGFPVNHSLWIPLGTVGDASRRDGPEIVIFGRLAGGVSLAQAQAELDALAARAAAAFPETDRHLRPVVQPYIESLLSDGPDSQFEQVILYSINLFFIGLLAVCGANIATLVFARTATRGAEISVRTALGASRARIAGQLFAEALVLCAVAAALGLTVASASLRWVKNTFVSVQATPAMFWWDDQLSVETWLYAAVLALMSAAIIGVVPALKATGPGVQDQLKRAAGGSGLAFGGVWTGVIVAQVSITVVFVAIAGTLGWSLYTRPGNLRETSFAASQFLYTRVQIDDAPVGSQFDDARTNGEFQRRYRASYEALERRLAAEPGVVGVSYATRLPGTTQGEWRIQVQGMAAHEGPDAGAFVRTTVVGPSLFETLGAPIVAGRGFHAADAAPDRHVAIVDQAFVTHVLGGQDAIGRHVRKAAEGGEAGPWLQIVGVVRDMSVADKKTGDDAVLYRVASPGAAYALQMAVRVQGDPALLAPRLRGIAASVDPSLRLSEPRTIAESGREDRMAISFFTRIIAGIGAVALLLSTAGVYALMSFTVARRTTEIGIRVALGASRARIFSATFLRALAQVALGVLAGLLPAGVIVGTVAPEMTDGAGRTLALAACTGVTIFMAVVTIAACAVPIHRALSIQPTQVLKGAD